MNEFLIFFVLVFMGLTYYYYNEVQYWMDQSKAASRENWNLREQNIELQRPETGNYLGISTDIDPEDIFPLCWTDVSDFAPDHDCGTCYPIKGNLIDMSKPFSYADREKCPKDATHFYCASKYLPFQPFLLSRRRLWVSQYYCYC